MNFEEHAAKPLLRAAGIAVPQGGLATTPAEAAAQAQALGPCVVKAQVPAGKRGKAGGILPADTPDQARAATERILDLAIGGHRVNQVLVEARVDIKSEHYAAILNDADSKGPLLLYSEQGGMDIEEIAERYPDRLVRLPIDIRSGLDGAALREAVSGFGFAGARDGLIDVLTRLYRVYAEADAELVEINPLAVTADGSVVALDCKLAIDDSGARRHPDLAKSASLPSLTALEKRARDAGLSFIELDGEVGVLSNGAGLTMTTMDTISHFGGRPANFLEIGGNAFVLGHAALENVLSNPRVRSLLINFCGAIARTDVMTEGVLSAWDAVDPKVPVFWTIHGTGEEEAIAMVKAKLGIEPYDLMDDAVRAAVEAAR